MENGKWKNLFWNHKIRKKIEKFAIKWQKIYNYLYVIIWNIKPRRHKQKKYL